MTTRALAALLLLSTTAAGAAIPVSPLADVVPRTDHIVRGEVDFAARTVTISRQYRGKIDGKTIRVLNLRRFGPPYDLMRPTGSGSGHPTHAMLLLQELDGRYYLVHERVPRWISPHSSVCYVSKEGRVQVYRQRMNPGPVVLTDRFADLEAFEKRLAELLEGLGPRKDRRTTTLSPEEVDGFYETISPYIDYYRREVTWPGEAEAQFCTSAVIDGKGPAELARYVDRLATYVREKEGEARSRGIEALLMLGGLSSRNQSRREAVERCLVSLVRELGPDPFVPVFFAEFISEDAYANQISPALVLRTVGGEAADRAADLLRRKIIESLPSALAKKCCRALKDMGRVKEAEAAWAECERREAERRKADREKEAR